MVQPGVLRRKRHLLAVRKEVIMDKAMTKTQMIANFKELAEANKSRLGVLLAKITFREREILKLRFGFGDGYTYTYEEVAHIFKTTRDRIRQIEEKGVRKMLALLNKPNESIVMQIDEAKQLKQDLAADITRLVNEFESRTGLVVLNTSLSRKDYTDSMTPPDETKSKLTSVHVSVRI